MAGNRSFTDYVTNRFYNEFYSAIEDYIEGNFDNLDIDLRNVHKVGQVSLTDMEVKFASINDLPNIKKIAVAEKPPIIKDK